MRVSEAGLVGALAALLSIIMITNIDECTSKQPYDDHAIVAKVSDTMLFLAMSFSSMYIY